MNLRVVVPYPNHGSILPETEQSLVWLKEDSSLNVEVIVSQGSNIPRARNCSINLGKSTSKFQQLPWLDYVLCVDADIVFSVDDVKLLLSRGKDIVGGLYPKKDYASLGTAGMLNENKTFDNKKFFDMGSNGIHPVDWIGAGFLLISRRALEWMEYPWFRYEIISWRDEEGEHQDQLSEDIGFCVLARRYGFTVYADCDVNLQHLK